MKQNAHWKEHLGACSMHTQSFPCAHNVQRRDARRPFNGVHWRNTCEGMPSSLLLCAFPFRTAVAITFMKQHTCVCVRGTSAAVDANLSFTLPLYSSRKRVCFLMCICKCSGLCLKNVACHYVILRWKYSDNVCYHVKQRAFALG